VSIKVLKIT